MAHIKTMGYFQIMLTFVFYAFALTGIYGAQWLLLVSLCCSIATAAMIRVNN